MEVNSQRETRNWLCINYVMSTRQMENHSWQPRSMVTRRCNVSSTLENVFVKTIAWYGWAYRVLQLLHEQQLSACIYLPDFRCYLSSWNVTFWLSFQNNLTCFIFFYRHASFFAFFISKKKSATYAFHMCVEYDKTKQTPSNKIWYDIYIRQILYKNTCLCVPF